MLKAHGIKAGGRTNTAAKEESTTGSSNGENVSPAKRKAKAPAASPAKRRARTTRVAKKEDSDEEPKPIAKAKGLKQEEDVTPASPTSSLSGMYSWLLFKVSLPLTIVALVQMRLLPTRRNPKWPRATLHLTQNLA